MSNCINKEKNGVSIPSESLCMRFYYKRYVISMLECRLIKAHFAKVVCL